MLKKIIFYILHIFIYAAIFLYSAVAGLAQDFTVDVKPNPIVQGQDFQVAFTFKGDGRDFRAPGFSPFKVVAGPYRSSGTTIINGNFSTHQSFTYVLRAERTGNFTIEPASITAGGSKFTTKPVTVRVLEPSDAEKERRRQEADAEKNINKEAEQIIQDNLFIRVNLSKNSSYTGEQIIATYKIFVNPDLNLVKLEPADIPMFQGFWKQEIDLGKQQWAMEYHNDKLYRTLVFKKLALLPQQSGKLTIDPWAFESVVRLRVQSQRRPRDLFDEFFGSQNVKDFQSIIKSPALSVNVKALPAGAPLSFNGAVGNLNMESWLDKTETSTDNPVTLKIKISGTGNLTLLSVPDVEVPPGLEKYEPKEIDNTAITASGISGNKTYEYLILPRTAGDYKIGPVEFSYFNPDKGEYVTLTSETFNLNVQKGEGGSDITSVGKESLQYLGKDIRFIKDNTVNLTNGSRSFFGTLPFYLMTILPFAGIFLLLLYRRNKEKEDGNVLLMKTRTANKVAKKRLSTARKYMAQNQDDQFYEEVSRALWGYLSDKLAIPVSALTRENADNNLARRGISEETRIELISTIDSCEFARYAPSSQGSDKQSIYNEAERLIMKIEEEIK